MYSPATFGAKAYAIEKGRPATTESGAASAATCGRPAAYAAVHKASKTTAAPPSARRARSIIAFGGSPSTVRCASGACSSAMRRAARPRRVNGTSISIAIEVRGGTLIALQFMRGPALDPPEA